MRTVPRSSLLLIRRTTLPNAGQDAHFLFQSSRIEAEPVFWRMILRQFAYADLVAWNDDALAIKASAMLIDDVLHEMYGTARHDVIAGSDGLAVCLNDKPKGNGFCASAGVCALQETIVYPFQGNGYWDDPDCYRLYHWFDCGSLLSKDMYQGTTPS